MPRIAQPVLLDPNCRLELERWVAAHQTPQQVSQRCRILMMAADGQRDMDIAEALQINSKTVSLWRKRFLSEGVQCLWEVAPGRGRKATHSPEKISELIQSTRKGTICL